jgi:hypothetical protein
MIDPKIMELATRLTERAMGTTTSIDSWIGKEDQVAKFLTIAVKTLDDLYKETNHASQKRSPP